MVFAFSYTLALTLLHLFRLLWNICFQYFSGFFPNKELKNIDTKYGKLQAQQYNTQKVDYIKKLLLWIPIFLGLSAEFKTLETDIVII